ncbi:MAG: hypothetical protein IPK16_11065 [Anaerolineales bacterium]|nr:hypothetical protein [Anaerolineales bacterium]
MSGDLDIDITNASLGAFSLAVPGSAPANADSALALIHTTYPSLGNVALEPDNSGASGYVFAASTMQQGVSRETHQVNAAAQEVLAGVSGQGSARVVWVVIGNGTFATALAPIKP